MAASSIQNPPPAVGPALPASPSRSQTGSSWPRATLPPSLLAGAATATPPPPIRRSNPAAAITSQQTKKRGAPPLPPSVNGAKKKPMTTAQQTPPPPPASFSGGVVVAAAPAVTTAERRLALDKKVAGCLLTRSWAGTAAARRRQGQAALRCLCPELPRGSRCALHQDAPGRSRMEQQKGGAPPVGGDGEVLVPTVGAAGDAEVYAEYARWRRNVRMPSRFYVQHVRAIAAGTGD